VGAPFVAGLAETGGKAAERFGAVAKRWKVSEDEKKQKIEGIIKEITNAPLRGETSQSSRRPYEALLKLAEPANLPKLHEELGEALTEPLVKLKEALEYKDEVVQDAAVVAALVLYKALINNAEAYGEWAELYKWARGLVEEREFAVKAEEVARLRGSQKRLEEVAEEVRRELNRVLVLYSQSDFYKERPDLLNKLKQHLEVDIEKAEELAMARGNELYELGGVNMGTKAYAALLSISRGGIYGHAATLLMGEGALADVVLLTPKGAYDKAKGIAKGRGESVDPSRSPKGAVDWEDRAASVFLRFLIGYGEADLKFRRVEKRGEKGRVERGFQVFRAYGVVEAFVGELWIGEVAYFNVSKEELRRFVEEAKRTAPDLSGIKKIWQTLEWLNTDMSFLRGWIVAATAQPWQLAWYIALFGEGKIGRGGANVTRKGGRPNVTMYWPREVLDRIIAEEGEELRPLLGRAVKSWQELVDAIDWSWVLKRVEELVDELKPWIGRKKMDDAEREGLVRRMLGELALLVHFAEAKRGENDGEWKEERAARLAKAVEVLSGGRITGNHANELARAIIRYAEERKKDAKKRIESLAEKVGVSREEVWSIVEFVLSDMYCLARDCARDAVVRKFVAPALELIMLDKALRGELDREEDLLRFGEMYATALAGDGTVWRRLVELAVGGELGGGAALLRLATLHLLNQLLSRELKFNVRIYVKRGIYRITATGENTVKLKRLLAVSAPSAGGGYLSPKFDQFVKEAQVEVQISNIRPTKSGVAAYLTISEAGVAVKYNVYLHDAVVLQFVSSDRSRAELAARLLKLAGVSAEVKKEGGRDVWYVIATTDKLAVGHVELRNALAEVVREAIARGWMDANKAEGWLKKLEEGRVLKEGWPEYYVGLVEGALRVRFSSTNPVSIERERQRLKEMGLEEGRHFTVKMPEGGRDGYVYVRREGLERAARLSVRGEGERQRLAAEFVEYILQRAEKAGDDIYEKAKEIVEEGKARGSLTLKGFEREVEVNSEKYKVKIIDGEAVEEDRGGRKLLRIKITAEIDGVRREYTITYSRLGRDKAAVGRAYARGDAPEVREADAERFSALIKALTGREPKVYQRSDDTIEIVCGREHLEGFRRFAELADAIEKWLEGNM
jgi:hypothetical protein